MRPESFYRVDLYDYEYGDLDSVHVYRTLAEAIHLLDGEIGGDSAEYALSECSIRDGVLRLTVVKARDPDITLAYLYPVCFDAEPGRIDDYTYVVAGALAEGPDAFAQILGVALLPKVEA